MILGDADRRTGSARHLGQGLAALSRSILLPLLLLFNAAWAGDEGEWALTGATPSPPLRLQDLQGEDHRLGDYRGRVVIVNFWASWCPPCREELPSMNRAWEALQSERVAMLAINLGEEAEAVEAFVADHPIRFPVLLDPSGAVSRAWQVRGLPTTFVLNPEGEIVHRDLGGREWDRPGIVERLRALSRGP